MSSSVLGCNLHDALRRAREQCTLPTSVLMDEWLAVAAQLHHTGQWVGGVEDDVHGGHRLVVSLLVRAYLDHLVEGHIVGNKRVAVSVCV